MLARAAADSPGHAATLADRLVAAMPGSTRPDGVVVMALARREAAGQPLVVRLPAEAKSLGPLRERLRRWLAAEGFGRTEAGDVLLAVGEAASNAIELPIEPQPAAIVTTLTRAQDGETRIEVRDHGGWDAEPSNGHRGRGMHIMHAIAAGQVAIDRGAQGTTRRSATAGACAHEPDRVRHRGGLRRARRAPAGRHRHGGDGRAAGRAGRAVAEHRARCLVVDLSSVESVDSSGIELLFRLNGALGADGIGLIVVAPPGSSAARLLGLVALSDIGEVRPSLAAALDACGEREAR